MTPNDSLARVVEEMREYTSPLRDIAPTRAEVNEWADRIAALTAQAGDWVMVPRECVAQASAALDILGRRDLAGWLMRSDIAALTAQAGDKPSSEAGDPDLIITAGGTLVANKSVRIEGQKDGSVHVCFVPSGDARAGDE